jgi:hypothetical protein
VSPAGVIIGVFGAGAVTAALRFAGREGSPRLTVATVLILAGIVAFSMSRLERARDDAVLIRRRIRRAAASH